MARRQAVTTISFEGPFFTHDPAKTFRQNIRAMADAVAAEGEADVKAQLAVGNSQRAPIRQLPPDHVSAHVVGRTRALGGKRWAVTAVVSVNNSGFTKAQGISLMAAASRVEAQTHAFRKTANRIRRAKSKNIAELMKGIA